MKYFKTDRLNVRKAARFAIVLNTLQVFAIAAAIAYVVITDTASARMTELGVLVLALAIVAWGAVLDIREAFNAQRTAAQAGMLEEAYAQLEVLNGTLRKQRHDTVNHLQVMYSLLDMQSYGDAMAYIEGLLGDIQKAGSSLKTAIPAVNALIAAKQADCAEHGVELRLVLRSGWQGLPIPGWEMCRVLGNLIDNARDALLDAGAAQPCVQLEISEQPDAYGFRVTNNGPAIDAAHLPRIFDMGFTTKGDGRGSGLAIVRDILESHGGSISVRSNDEGTAFEGYVPRALSDD